MVLQNDLCVEVEVCGGGAGGGRGGVSTHTAAVMNDHYYTLLRTTSLTSSIHVCKKTKKGKEASAITVNARCP